MHKLNTNANAARAMGLLVHTNIRTPDWFRMRVSQRFKGGKNVSHMKAVQYGARLMQEQLPAADRVMDVRVQKYAESLVRGTGIPAPKIDLDWPKIIHDDNYRENLRTTINPDGDPLLNDLVLFVHSEVAEIRRLARGIFDRGVHEFKAAGRPLTPQD